MEINAPDRIPNVYKLLKSKGGFQIKSTDNNKFTGKIRVQVAYDVARGNPIKKWDKRDFCLSDSKKFKVDRKNFKIIKEHQKKISTSVEIFWDKIAKYILC